MLAGDEDLAPKGVWGCDKSLFPRVGCKQQGRTLEETPPLGGSAWTS